MVKYLLGAKDGFALDDMLFPLRLVTLAANTACAVMWSITILQCGHLTLSGPPLDIGDALTVGVGKGRRFSARRSSAILVRD